MNELIHITMLLIRFEPDWEAVWGQSLWLFVPAQYGRAADFVFLIFLPKITVLHL